MITTINEWKRLNESLEKSLDSQNLYIKLLPLFNPVYNIQRPSGHYSNNIEMKFNKNTSYTDVKNIIKESNWYLSLINNGAIRNLNFKDSDINNIEIKPIYEKNTIEMPNILYHISPTLNDELILQNGLVGSTGGKKGILHPKRIYLCKDVNTLMRFVKELNYSINSSDWTIFQINTNSIKNIKLYIDDTVNQSFTKPMAVYIQDTNIPATSLKIYEHIKL